VIVRAGQEGFSSELGPWSFLGAGALTQLRDGAGTYTPDYDAYAQGPCRLVQFSQTEFDAALRASRAEIIAPRSLAVAAAARSQRESREAVRASDTVGPGDVETGLATAGGRVMPS